MAVKVIETEDGKTVQKTYGQIKRDRIFHKAQKYISTAAFIAGFMAVMSINAFATDNEAPTNVQTDTMSSLMGIIWWIVRVAILIIGCVPGVIKFVQGQADENPRDRNAGITTAGIAAAIFGATFAIEAVVNAQTT